MRVFTPWVAVTSALRGCSEPRNVVKNTGNLFPYFLYCNGFQVKHNTIHLRLISQPSSFRAVNGYFGVNGVQEIPLMLSDLGKLSVHR